MTTTLVAVHSYSTATYVGGDGTTTETLDFTRIVVSTYPNLVTSFISQDHTTFGTPTPSPTSLFTTPEMFISSSPPTEGNAGPLHITGPSSVEYCSQIIATWGGGTPPYRFMAFTTNFAPQEWQGTMDQGRFQLWNGMVTPGKFFQISVTDYYNNTDYLMYTVSGSGDLCSGASSASNTINQGVNVSSPKTVLSTGAIIGIAFGALAFLVLCLFLVLWVRRKRPTTNRTQTDLNGDRASLITRRSGTSLLSSFGRRNNGRNTSVEDGGHSDDTPNMQENRAPSSRLQAILPLLTIRRASREWNRYPLSNQNRRRSHRIIGHQTPDTRSRSIPEETEYTSPIPSSFESTESPFDDIHHVAVENDHLLKIPPSDTSRRVDTDADVPQLSSSELEALADMVAARLNQRMGHSTGPRSQDSHTTESEELPRYS